MQVEYAECDCGMVIRHRPDGSWVALGTEDPHCEGETPHSPLLPFDPELDEQSPMFGDNRYGR